LELVVSFIANEYNNITYDNFIFNYNFFKIMYINDRRLRLILFAPLFFKDVITQGSVQEDSPDLTSEAKEIVKNQVDRARWF